MRKSEKKGPEAIKPLLRHFIGQHDLKQLSDRIFVQKWPRNKQLSFFERLDWPNCMDVITRGQYFAIFHIQSFLGCSLVFKGCRSGMCWCHWIKERTFIVGCKCVYCVCTTVFTVYNSTHLCNFAPFWSYFCGPILLKNFSFPWSHLLCVTYNFQSLQKCFMWTIDNPNQMQTMFWESMNVSELLKMIFKKKISGKSLKFCGLNLKFGISTHRFGLQLQCTSEHILVTNLLFSFPLPHF